MKPHDHHQMYLQVVYHHVLLESGNSLLYMDMTLSASLISRPDSHPDSDRVNDRANDRVFEMRDYMEDVYVTVIQRVNEFKSSAGDLECLYTLHMWKKGVFVIMLKPFKVTFS